MFKTRVRKILGDVFTRRGRTLLVSIAIFIGVAGVIALSTLGDVLIRQLREDLKEEELSMLQVFVTTDASAQLDDAAYIDTLDNVNGVSQIMGVGQAAGFFKLNPDDEDYEDAIYNAYTVPYEPRLPIEPMRLLEGGRYPAAGADEVVIEQRLAEEYGLSVGDTLYVRVLSPSRDPEAVGEIDTLEARTITGIVFHPYAQTPVSSIYAASVDDVNYITASTGLSTFLIRFVDYATALDQEDAVLNAVSDTPYRVVFSLVQDPAQNPIIQNAQTLAGTMTLLAFIALVVSGFLVINVVSAIIVEQKRQIGVMKSIGATRWDNIFMYSGIAFMYGLIGVIPGMIVGILGGNAAAQALAPTFNTILDGFQISATSILIGVAIGLLVPVLAAMIPVWSGTRVKILDAMTDLGIDARYGTGPIARLIGILPIPITVRQGLSNVSLKKSRLAFTVVTLAIAAGAFMGIFALFGAVTEGIGQFFDIFNVEVGAFPNQGRDPEEVITIIQENFQTEDNNVIRSIEPGFQTQVEFEGYEPVISTGGPPGIFAYGYAVESETPAFNVDVAEGEPLSEANAAEGVIFSSLLARNMDKNVGDRVVMKVPGNSVELTIVGIADFPLDQIWIDWRTLALVTGYVTTPNVESPVPLPTGSEEILRYVTNVTTNGSEDVPVLGLKPEALGFFPALISEGQMFTRGTGEVIVSGDLAAAGGYSVGDTLTVTSTQTGGITQDVTITGILNLPPGLAAGDFPTSFIAAYWEDLVTLDGVILEATPQPQGYFLLTTLDNPTSEDVQVIADELNEVLLANGIPSQSFNFIQLTEQFTETFSTFQVILQMVAGLIALVGALGLLTTLSMSVFERQKEIGVMRSIGASSVTVATQFLTEGLVVGIIAWVIGIPLALLIQSALLNATGLGETFPATFPVTGVVLGLVGMLVVTTVASLSPSLSAARKTVSDILRYQ
ncbi:MAG: hypothetical protein OHK0046_26330 [Anaerolineae bacterium]